VHLDPRPTLQESNWSNIQLTQTSHSQTSNSPKGISLGDNNSGQATERQAAGWRTAAANQCYKAIPWVHIQSPCACFALFIVHVSTKTTCNTIDVDKAQHWQSPLCARFFPYLITSCAHPRLPFLRACPAPVCTCLARAHACACVVFARVCNACVLCILFTLILCCGMTFQWRDYLAPMHWHKQPAELVIIVVSLFGWSDPKLSTCPCPAFVYMHLAVFYLSVLHFVLLPQHDKPAHMHTHIETHTQPFCDERHIDTHTLPWHTHSPFVTKDQNNNISKTRFVEYMHIPRYLWTWLVASPSSIAGVLVWTLKTAMFVDFLGEKVLQ